jgi:hypothetical protein
VTIAGNSDPCDLCDSQSVKTADQAGERGCDAGKKVSGRKRHAAVDCLGLILAIMITPAAVQDRDAAKGLIQFIPPSYVYPADKRPLRALLRQRLFFVWQRSDLLARIQSHQLAHRRLLCLSDQSFAPVFRDTEHHAP